MNENIITSIIITNFNYSKYLNRAIRSALMQDCPELKYEIIVVDDGSTDCSKELISSFGKWIKPIFLERNYGLSYARNRGIDKSIGKYIMFLDADDYISRYMVNIGTWYLEENKDCDAVAFDYYIVDDNEVRICRKSFKQDPLACGIFFVKEKINKMGGYNEVFKINEDIEFKKRFDAKFNLKIVEMPLYRYRSHDCNMSKTTESHYHHTKHKDFWDDTKGNKIKNIFKMDD